MPWIIGLGASQPYSRGEFQETLWERFRCLSRIIPEFLPGSPSRTRGMAQSEVSKRGWREGVGENKPPKRAPKGCPEVCPPPLLSGIVSCDAAAIRIQIRVVRCQRPAKRQNTQTLRNTGPFFFPHFSLLVVRNWSWKCLDEGNLTLRFVWRENVAICVPKLH